MNTEAGPVNPIKGYFSSINFAYIVATAKKVLLNPTTVWPELKAEPKTIKAVLLDYVVILMAIAAVARLVVDLGHGFIFRGVGLLIASLIMQVGGFYLVSLLAQKIATFFNAQPSLDDTAKLVGFSHTAPLLVGAITTLLNLGFLNALAGLAASLYGIYTFYKGVNVMTGVPNEKALPYTVILAIAALVVMMIIGTVLAAVFIVPAATTATPEQMQDMMRQFLSSAPGRH